MGIPGLFYKIIENYNNSDTRVIKKHIENDLPNHLYLDFNCAIYTALYSNIGIKTDESLILLSVFEGFVPLNEKSSPIIPKFASTIT